MKVFLCWMVVVLLHNLYYVQAAVSSADLMKASEDMFLQDETVTKRINKPTINLQDKISPMNKGKNYKKLITNVPAELTNTNTMKALQEVLDAYGNSHTPVAVRKTKEDNFLNAVVNTPVMKHLQAFLVQKALILPTETLRQKLEALWFAVYQRYGQSSSGFKHVFVGEWNGNKVEGFHNWLSYYKEQKEGHMKYKGHYKHLAASKFDVVQISFHWYSSVKAVGSMIVGTTPELEMALYTMCFLARKDNLCPVSLDGHQFHIQTYDWFLQSARVATAYPVI